MIVLGIDPGLANTGYGVVRSDAGRLVALDGGVIETRAGLPVERRLADIHAAIDALLAEHEPQGMALEQLYFGQNVKTAFAVGQARGVTMLAAGQRGVPCESYTPAEDQGRRVRQRPCGQGSGRADGAGVAGAGGVADAGPCGRCAGGGDLPRELRAAVESARGGDGMIVAPPSRTILACHAGSAVLKPKSGSEAR